MTGALPIIWALADDRPGNRAQCLGVADRVGIEYLIKEIVYNRGVKFPNVLRGAGLMGIASSSKQAICAPWPDVVIAAGRRAAPIARYIKRKSPKTKLVQLMWPDAGIADFDCIVLPSHDKEHPDMPRILRVLGAPHRITPSLLDAAAEKWRPAFAHLPPGPRIALLAGGNSKHGKFDISDFHRMGSLAASLATDIHGSIFLTTSRRTGAEGEKALLSHIEHIPHHKHLWQQSSMENPYLGYLALADAVIVSGDSIAMCSEACAMPKPVFIYQPESLSAKHARFVNTLIATGYAYPLDEDFVAGLRKPLKHKPLDSAATVAEHIRKEWLTL